MNHARKETLFSNIATGKGSKKKEIVLYTMMPKVIVRRNGFEKLTWW